MTSNSSRTIFVLGMHRSGTSALAGALVNAGVYAGDASTLYEADNYNEKGFYEQRSVVDINESVLISNFIKNYPELIEYGCTESVNDLNGLGWLFGAWLDKNKISDDSKTVDRMSEFLLALWSKNSEYNGFIVKDPRFSLTFPLWERYLDEPIIIIMVRNPTAVASSLWRRDKIYESLSYELWQRYTHTAMVNAINHRAFVIDYDQLVEYPERMMDKMFSWLNEKGFNFTDHMHAKAVHFISSSLRHHKVHQIAELTEEILKYYEQIIKYSPLLPSPPIPKIISNNECPWQSALYLLSNKTAMQIKSNLKSRLLQVESRLLQAELAHHRLVNHPITGTTIRLVSKLKKDKSFGALNYQPITQDGLTATLKKN